MPSAVSTTDPMKDHCAATVMASPEVVAALAAITLQPCLRGIPGRYCNCQPHDPGCNPEGTTNGTPKVQHPTADRDGPA
jgi:hypothetical protein